MATQNIGPSAPYDLLALEEESPSLGEGLQEANWIERLFPWLARPGVMKAEEGAAGPLAFLLILAMSLALILVFGHSELVGMLSPTSDYQTRFVDGVSLAILVAATLAADLTARKSIARIDVLMRLQKDVLAWEHVCYVGFVMSVEAVTFGIALYVIEEDPARLFKPGPILPMAGILLFGQFALRAIMVGWSFIQIQLTKKSLGVPYDQVHRVAQERVAGMYAWLLRNVKLRMDSLPAVALANGELQRPLPRRETFWNRGAIRRDRVYAAQVDEQTRRVVEAFSRLTSNNLEERARAAEAERDREREEAQRTMTREREEAQRAILQAQSASTQKVGDALLAFLSTGTLPEWLVAERPELASLTREALLGGYGPGGPRGGTRRIRALLPTPSTPTSRAERHRLFLAELGLEESRRPAGVNRGVYVDKRALNAMLSKGMDDDELRVMMNDAGAGKAGTSLVAPLDKVAELVQRRGLMAPAVEEAWTRVMGDASEGDTGEQDAVNATAVEVAV